MTKEQRTKCNAIIHSASASAGAVGAGFAQLPGSDSVIITPIQTAMVLSLGKVLGFTLNEGAAKATISSVAFSAIGRTCSQLLIGWLPIAGNIVNAATAFSLTETLGWIIAEEFDEQQRMAD